jgi:ABC-type maltose transport system permease subunit
MIPDPELQMAPAALNFFSGASTDQLPDRHAAAILVALPVTVVYYVLQRCHGADVLAGSLKG